MLLLLYLKCRPVHSNTRLQNLLQCSACDAVDLLLLSYRTYLHIQHVYCDDAPGIVREDNPPYHGDQSRAVLPKEDPDLGVPFGLR